MKTLVVIRHAKSSWEFDALHDLERPLTDRGVRDAHLIGQLLQSKNLKPGLVLSSPALRALSTARIICDEIEFDKNKLELHADLYFKEIPDILKIIQQKGLHHDVLYIFGHNPTFSNLAHAFTKTFTDMMPTCGVVVIDFEIHSWQFAELTQGNLRFYEVPKNYRNK